MKTIYFVRHAESEGNAGTHYQEGVTPLSVLGKAQAQALADRTKKLPVEVIVSSTMVRAMETTKAIAMSLDVPIEYSDIFIERRRPSEQINQLKTSNEVIEAEDAIIQNSGISGYRYSDEENFDDLKVRAKLALDYLEAHPTQNILVVTHGVFLRVLLTFGIFGGEVTEREYKGILSGFTSSNTGVTVMKYDESRTDHPWTLLTWNDYAHLG